MAKKTTKTTKKSEAAASDVRVRLTDIFEYRLDASRRRTLPKGWAGKVPAAIADKIEAEGKGGRDAGFDEELALAEATAATAKAAKTDAADATAGSSSTATGETDGAATETSTATQTDAAPAAGADTAASTDLLSGTDTSTD